MAKPKVKIKNPFSNSPAGADRRPTIGGTPPKGHTNTPPGPAKWRRPFTGTVYEDGSWSNKPTTVKRRRKPTRPAPVNAVRGKRIPKVKPKAR